MPVAPLETMMTWMPRRWSSAICSTMAPRRAREGYPEVEVTVDVPALRRMRRGDWMEAREGSVVMVDIP